MTTKPATVRDALDLAAQHVAFRDKLGIRPAKAKVHAMAWTELLDILGQSGTTTPDT